jgi:5-methylcytosine-specific restriction endonuclease McrA
MTVTPLDLELLGRGNLCAPIEEREILLGYLKGQPDYQRLSSFLLGGQTGQGKSQVAAHLCCMAVLSGAQLWVIDPHGHETQRGLLPKIEPLREWFANDPFALDFLDDLPGVVDEFESAYLEYKRRKAKHGMLGKKPLFLVVDELNELLGDIKLEVGVKEATRVGQIVANFSRGGAKYGCYALIMGHNWQMSKSGGSDVRPNIRGRIALLSDSMTMVLNCEKEELKRFVKKPLLPGIGIVRRPAGGLCRMKFPLTEREDCAAIADLMRFIEGKVAEFSAYSGYSGHQIAIQLPLELSEHPEHATHPKPLAEPVQGTQLFTSPHLNPLETYLIYLNNNLNSSISLADLQKITAEGNKQIQHTGKVIRTEIMNNLNWNRYKYQRLIMPVCDLLGWDRQMDKHLTTQVWEEIKAKYDYTCPDCGRREPEIVLTRDHIIPKAKGGSDEPSNIAPRCFSCNASKREK